MNELKFLDDLNGPVSKTTIGLGVGAFVLGIVSVAMSIVLTGFLFGLVGLILGIMGISKSHKSMSAWGIGLSLSGMLLSCIFGLAYYAGAAHRNDEGATISEYINKPAPELTFVFPDGNTAKLSDYKGRPVWLNFWDPYDLRSRDTAVLLSETMTRYPDCPKILGISTITDGNEMKVIGAMVKINYQLCTTEGTIDEYEDLFTLPATVFIGADGLIYDVMKGYHDPNTLARKAAGLNAKAAKI